MNDLNSMNTDLTQIICISEHLSNFASSGTLQPPDSPQNNQSTLRHRRQGQGQGQPYEGDKRQQREGQNGVYFKTLPAKRRSEGEHKSSANNQHTLPR